MRYRYNRSYRYRLTSPPKALLKARMDNIAIVPASMLGLKALWQTTANTLPQGGVLLCHSQQNTRQRKLLERIGETFREHAHNALQADYGSCSTYSMVSPLHPGHPIMGIPPVYSPRNVAAPIATSMMASLTSISSLQTGQR
jgi:hypothetical protein